MANRKRLSVGAKLLLLLSRKPGTADFGTAEEEWNLTNALSVLYETFPNFLNAIVDKEILDFGCGTGWQSVALARAGAHFVLGLEKNPSTLAKAQHLAKSLSLDDQVQFEDILDERFTGRFDLVISLNSMEHFSEPTEALAQMKSALKVGGKILVSFGPLWFSPYGAHMGFFTKLPWVNLLFCEESVMNVRAYFRSDGAKRYADVESGLNKMTVAKFEHIVSASGLRIEYCKYDCIKRLNGFHRVPLLRELFVNQISCVLTRS